MQPRKDQSIRVPAEKSRKLVGGTVAKRDERVVATIGKQGQLQISGQAPELHLRYAASSAGNVSLFIEADAVVWIESWDPNNAPATLTIDIAPGARVGLSESVMAAAADDGVHVTFNSAGTGCVAATWHMARTSPALRVSGMAPGDRLNLSVRDNAGSTHNLDSSWVSTDASSAPQCNALTAWLPGIDPTSLVSANESCLTMPLPIGVDELSWQQLQQGASTEGTTPVVDAPPAGAAVTAQGMHYDRAALTASQWKRYAPVVFEADALACGMPQRRVVLAPGQAVRFKGHTVAAHQLVNGHSVTRDETGHCLAYVVPTGVHGVIDAAGLELAAETSICPTLNPFVEIARQQSLAHVSIKNNMTLVADPALRLEFNGLIVDGDAPNHINGAWRFTLPNVIPPGDLRIVSRSAVARDTSALPIEDDRLLGVALSAILIKSGQSAVTMNLSHPDWVGLHPWEYRRGVALRWTNGLASIPDSVHKLTGGETIELHVAAVHRYWIHNDLLIDEQEAAT